MADRPSGSPADDLISQVVDFLVSLMSDGSQPMRERVNAAAILADMLVRRPG